MTKGIVLDMIGSVQVDLSGYTQIFENPEENPDHSPSAQKEHSPAERKTKLLEYLVNQRRIQVEYGLESSGAKTGEAKR